MHPLTRRRFLVGTGSAGIAAGLLQASVAKAAYCAGSDRLRVGIIGATGRGDYGHGVDVAFKKIPRVEIVAVADHDTEGRKAATARTGAMKSYGDYGQMLQQESLDLVAICPRWIDQHESMISAAASAGCHVYMEKPFCRTLAECDRVCQLLNEKNLQLAIAHVSQYSPVLSKVQEIIEAGEIGTVLEIRGRGKEDHRGGGEDLWVLGSHIFGLMRTIGQGNALSCYATVSDSGQPLTREHVREGAEGIGLLAGDHVQASYQFPEQVTGYFASRRGMSSSPSRFAIQVFGSKGVIEMETGYLSPARILKDGSWSPGRSGKSWQPISSAGIDIIEPRTDGGYEGGHIAAITDLIAAAAEQRAPICGAEDARAITEMIAAVFESQRVGKTVTLPLKNRDNPLSLL